jgi:hypothetical protein
MRDTGTNSRSETDWARVDALSDDEIDTSDVPPLPDGFFENARWRMPDESPMVVVRVDPETLDWFTSLGDASEGEMTAALRLYARAQRELAKNSR